MDRQLFLQLFFSNCLAITASKGKDYDPDDIPLMDTLDHAVATDTDVAKVLWIYYGKHVSAIRRYVLTGRVESEPLSGRLMDAVNYLGLIAYYSTYQQELHAAWRRHWVEQPCEYDSDTKLHQNCQRCQTLSWLERKAFGLNSKETSSPSTPKAPG